MSTPLEPIKPGKPPEEVSSFEERDNPLTEKVSQIFFDVIMATNPSYPGQEKRFERTATLLSTLLWFAKSGRIDPQLNKVILEELNTLSNNMVWNDVEKTIRKVIDLITSSDHRVEIIELLMELEHYFCIKPPENQTTVETKRFQQAISPLMEQLKCEMTAFGIRQLVNSLRSIRNRYLTHPNTQESLLLELESLSKSKKD